MASRLSQADVDFWEERHGEQRSIYFPDPDGVVFEVTWPPSTVRTVGNPQAATTVMRWARQSVTA